MTLPDATELARAVRDGALDRHALIDQAVRALEEVDGSLRAVVHWIGDRAHADADAATGPFAGVPIVAKDLDGTLAGAPYTASSTFLRGYVADRDSPVIARLKAAGFVFVAPTHGG